MSHVTDEQFQRLIDGSLEVEQSEALWHHLDVCEACLDRLSQWYQIENISLKIDDVLSTSDNFRRKLMRRINREEAVRSILNFSFNGLAALLGLFIKTGGRFGPKLPSSSKIEIEEK